MASKVVPEGRYLKFSTRKEMGRVEGSEWVAAAASKAFWKASSVQRIVISGIVLREFPMVGVWWVGLRGGKVGGVV